MNEDERLQASLAIRDLAHTFKLPENWLVVIRKPDGETTMEAGELVRRIEKRYPAC